MLVTRWNNDLPLFKIRWSVLLSSDERLQIVSFLGTILSLAYDAIHHSLTENWLRHWARPHINQETSPTRAINEVPATINIAENIETSNTYVAGSIGYEFVVDTAMRRHLFAVLQRPQEHVHIHQLNLQDGHLLDDLKLEPGKANQTFLSGTTETFVDKTTGKEYFAIGLQAGLIFIIDTDPLHIHTIVNGEFLPSRWVSMYP